MIRAVTTFGYVGLLRPAPGTWASALAVALAVAIDRWLGTPALAVLTLMLAVLGFRACTAALEGAPADADPGEIVIDEVTGQWLAFLFPAFGFWARGFEGWLPWPAWAAPFVLFRLFDIWKPWLVGRADRRGGARGVMEDDLWAGLFAGMVTLGLAGLWHGVMMR